jgi:hypothetical protein
MNQQNENDRPGTPVPTPDPHVGEVNPHGVNSRAAKQFNSFSGYYGVLVYKIKFRFLPPSLFLALILFPPLVCFLVLSSGRSFLLSVLRPFYVYVSSVPLPLSLACFRMSPLPPSCTTGIWTDSNSPSLVYPVRCSNHTRVAVDTRVAYHRAHHTLSALGSVEHLAFYVPASLSGHSSAHVVHQGPYGFVAGQLGCFVTFEFLLHLVPTFFP